MLTRKCYPLGYGINKVNKMEKLHIERKASDNKYLHKDFHISADIGITYVGENYGDRAVKDYLTQYTKSFYKLLAEDVNKNGLKSLEENFINVYNKEEWRKYLHTELTEDKLNVKIDKCPAVVFMKSTGHTPSKWYKETTYTVYAVLAEMCGLEFTVNYYNEEDGSTEFEFTRRK